MKIDYRFSQEIHYVINQSEPDTPVVLTFNPKDGAFESEDLGDQFYPTRESLFNIEFNNIKIASKKDYILDYSSDVVSTTVISELASALEDMGVDAEHLT